MTAPYRVAISTVSGAPASMRIPSAVRMVYPRAESDSIRTIPTELYEAGPCRLAEGGPLPQPAISACLSAPCQALIERRLAAREHRPSAS